MIGPGWRFTPRLLLGVAALVLWSACAPTPQAPARTETAPASGSVPSAPSASREPRGTIKVAWIREPDNLSPKFISGSGAGEYTWTFSSALAIRDLEYTPHPMIARELPSQENGTWVVNPDGSMVTTYRLRENARWHDGAPITAEDFAFAYRVYTDDAMPVGVRAPESLMSSVEARDPHTLVINWKETYVGANALGYRMLHPLPSHLLAEKYATNRAGFATGEEWNHAFVGSGPFKVERWEPGSRIIARAHRDFFLGSPKVDTLEIRFISDLNTILANLLAGEVDMINSPSVGASEAVVARDQWVARGEGYLKTWFTRTAHIDFQHREVPNWQRAVSDVRVRQALVHALDRQGMADVINSGLAPTADAYIAPADPVFRDVDRAIMKYPFDPNRAAALFADAGWRRSGTDGPLTDAGGRSFDLEVWADQEDEAAIVADYWKRAGLNTTPFRVPNARRNDQEFRNHFTGTQLGSNTISQEELHVVSSKLPKAELGWLGSNRGSFSDPEVDRLHNIIRTSLNENDRRQATIGMHKRISEVVAFQPIYYIVELVLAKNKVKGPAGSAGPQTGITWNVWDWEVE
jgi:peptide/nickel transport system substrate-binding protein